MLDGTPEAKMPFIKDESPMSSVVSMSMPEGLRAESLMVGTTKG